MNVKHTTSNICNKFPISIDRSQIPSLVHWLIEINKHFATYYRCLENSMYFSSSTNRGLAYQSNNLFGARPELTTERGRGSAICNQSCKKCLRHVWVDVRNHRVDKLSMLRIWPGFTLNRNNFESPEKGHNRGWSNLICHVPSRANPGSLSWP